MDTLKFYHNVIHVRKKFNFEKKFMFVRSIFPSVNAERNLLMQGRSATEHCY